ncbi:hypothetical protein LTR86_007525 [Recurvomyces mirabilis]|nr:hypothetical protein LTR86_007525 [Recurvomyces mirabilis]
MSSLASPPPRYWPLTKPAWDDQRTQHPPHLPRVRDFAYEHARRSGRNRPHFVPVNIRLGRTTSDQSNPIRIDIVNGLSFVPKSEDFPPTRTFSRTAGVSVYEITRTLDRSRRGMRCHIGGYDGVTANQSIASASTSARAERARCAKQRQRQLQDLRALKRLTVIALCFLALYVVVALVLHADHLVEIARAVANAVGQLLQGTEGTSWADWSAPGLVLAGFVASMAGFSIVGIAAFILFSWLDGKSVEAAVLSTVTGDLTTSVTSPSAILPASTSLPTSPGAYNISLLPNMTLTGPHQADISAGSCYYPNCVYGTVNSAGSRILPESVIGILICTSVFMLLIWGICKAAFGIQAIIKEAPPQSQQPERAEQAERREQAKRAEQAMQVEASEPSSPELDMETDEVFEYETGMNKETIFPPRSAESCDDARLSKRQKRIPFGAGASRSRSGTEVYTLKKRKVVVPRRTVDVDERVDFMHYPPSAVEQDFRSSL